MNFNVFVNILNNREISIVIWTAILLGWSLFNSNIRKSLKSVARAFFRKKIIFPIIAMILYVGLIIYFLENIGAWDFSLLKNTIIWFMGTAFVLIFNSPNALKNKKFFKKILLDNLKIILIVEFIVNLYIFSLLFELILIPLIFFVVTMGAVAETKKEFTLVKKIIDFILSVLGIILILHAVINIFSNYLKFIQIENLLAFTLPPLLTLLFIPFLFLFILMMKHENKIYNLLKLIYQKIK